MMRLRENTAVTSAPSTTFPKPACSTTASATSDISNRRISFTGRNPSGWVYSDCYPSYGLIETPSVIPGADNELSFYLFDGHWMGEPTRLYRYSMRMDGFVSLHAGTREKVIVTKPFTFGGDALYANLSTSARRYAYFTLTDENGRTLTSCETFGNSVDKRIHFSPDSLSELSEKCVTLTVRMREADIYSIQFR